MEWFEGSIIEAIQTSKAKQAFFVVYIEGTDDASKTTTEVLNRPSVAEHLKGKDFVSIKLKKDTPEHKQFAEIYKMVPVPSVFFIGNNGLASEVVVGNNESANVEARLLAAIQKCASELNVQNLHATVSSTSSSVSVAATPGPSSAKVETAKLPMESGESPQTAAAPAPLEDRVEKAKKLVLQKNEEKKKEELEKEKLTERERRKIGQEMHKAKLSRQEQEMKEALEERKKDTLDNAAARKKILDQIAQDRKDRQERERSRAAAGASPPVEQQAPSSGSSSPQVNGDIARLQFRLPGGETRVHTFPGDTTLNQIRQFIDNNIVLPFSEYQIATTFPRREFTWRDNEQDLRSLNLLPSSVLLILPLPGSSTVAQTSGWAKATVAFFWSLITPLLSMRDYVSSLIWGGRANAGTSGSAAGGSSASSAPTRGTGPSPSQPPFGRTTIRKRGNIHTLGSEDDPKKDDNNTWNGNSTQQM
ncbi:UBX domain-containing protein [Nesidiocoris tenuis]|uniref:UBX domain-containing protein 4 n=1 Tax=Nesidiocoris tenuis TaxID=355587 RepID=A0ABN7AYR9_9HEMI|nr:UBX domain-containing protein [Nesidiocoris tenuis]